MASWRRAAALLGWLSVCAVAVDPYSSSDYIRRTGHSVAIIGKTLYIDGGEVALLYDGKASQGQSTYQMNDTLTIPLDVSWTNQTVPITPIAKTAPVFDGAALWVDQSTKSMYMWGGQGPWGNLSKTRDLWRFEQEGSAGSWSKQAAANPDVFMSIKRSTVAEITTCNGMGFYAGGFGSVWTDNSFATGSLGTPVPGMLTYNMTSGIWTNNSMAAVNRYETLIGGSAACLPSFGTSGKGMMMTIGGEIARREGYNSSEPNLVGLGNLTFWDIETQTWFSQQTTGDIPSPRSKFCTASADSPNGSVEIFLWGGYDALNKISFQDVYVLSIPGFVWIKTNVKTGGPRAGQQCIMYGRQMFVIGGKNSDKGFTASFRDPDPWINGIHVLDVSSLSWSSKYDAEAADYESPSVVNEWYSAGKQKDVTWTSDSVKALFVGKGKSSNSSGGNASSNGSSAGSSGSSSSAPIGAIVGGVVGGVAALVLAALAAFFFMRRTKQATNPNEQQPLHGVGYGRPGELTPPLYDQQQEKTPQELSSIRSPAMLATEERPTELAHHSWHDQQQLWHDQNETQWRQQGWAKRQPGYLDHIIQGRSKAHGYVRVALVPARKSEWALFHDIHGAFMWHAKYIPTRLEEILFSDHAALDISNWIGVIQEHTPSVARRCVLDDWKKLGPKRCVLAVSPPAELKFIVPDVETIIVFSREGSASIGPQWQQMARMEGQKGHHFQIIRPETRVDDGEGFERWGADLDRVRDNALRELTL
ncbi:hypothetical protein JX265_005904 [Neoarthrinium moseri]|uniref:Kelch repeat protein n=1 Tax=Neoarthrinium moseri TaxID=1658444 RepID=A0A9P9WNY9_9PEZI|nr:hypothetical protein JX265_005904 [Neoarthrinium moseri]